ncbi:unnamed protein product [Mytilus edulis]|uniref:ZMYM2-like/QRICH1 C-terminal domain-containing protein n=1 Tax=Mytilus edulis TaxID=6550 RepID=A0A8S3R7N0_MYTED|nr:unnamed protein product [Mytilus edulis]
MCRLPAASLNKGKANMSEGIPYFALDWSPLEGLEDYPMDEDLQDTLLQLDALGIPLQPPESNTEHEITTVAEIHPPPRAPNSPNEPQQSIETSENLPISINNDNSNDQVPPYQDEAAGVSKQFDPNSIQMDDEDIQVFILSNENKNTCKKTMYDRKLVQKFFKMKKEVREIQNIPENELDSLLANFLITVRKQDGTEYEPSSLKGMMSSVDRKLRRPKYGHSISGDNNDFQLTKDTLKTKMKVLKKQGKGNKPNRAQPLTDMEINSLYEKTLLGDSTPEAMINTLWLNNSVHFGLRGVTEHYELRWGYITLNTASDGMRYLQLNERQTKTRTGENVNDIRNVSPKMYECVGERDPVALYEKFASKRPSGMSNEMDPFYITKRTIPLTGAENKLWFIRQRLGSKSLASVRKVMKEKDNLDDNKRLTNHSARKYLVQKLKDNNVQDTDIMQISGHKNVQSIRNYSALNEDKHKQISNVLSNTTGEPLSPLFQLHQTYL